MKYAQKQIMDLIKHIPEEKAGIIISFIEFIKNEEDVVLLLEPDDEREILEILNDTEWCTGEEMRSLIEGLDNE